MKSSEQMANESNTNYDTIFGKMAVEQGLCTGEELKRCIEEVEVRGERPIRFC